MAARRKNTAQASLIQVGRRHIPVNCPPMIRRICVSQFRPALSVSQIRHRAIASDEP
jgi:hypothetical protein